MKWNRVKKLMGTMLLAMTMTGMLAGCGSKDKANSETVNSRQETEVNSTEVQSIQNNAESSSVESEQNATNAADNDEESTSVNLEVRFGDSGAPFTMHMENNETAQAIIRYVGTSDWRLPVYDRDDNVDYSVMEYYDIPSRYEIPSSPEMITEEKAGEVYYSDPNRIVLFYQDAEISAEYVKIGTFDATDEFVSAVENNPVLEGWGNKIIQISRP